MLNARIHLDQNYSLSGFPSNQTMQKSTQPTGEFSSVCSRCCCRINSHQMTKLSYICNNTTIFFRCYVVTQGSKIIKRGLATKEGCDDNDGSLLKNVLTALKQSLNDDSITKTCCSWSCCNYNSTTVALASAPTSINISSSGLVAIGNGSNPIYLAHNLKLILLLVMPIVLIYIDFV